VDSQAYRQHRDLIRLVLFLQNKDNKNKRKWKTNKYRDCVGNTTIIIKGGNSYIIK
jgi:hypothetical protein